MNAPHHIIRDQHVLIRRNANVLPATTYLIPGFFFLQLRFSGSEPMQSELTLG